MNGASAGGPVYATGIEMRNRELKEKTQGKFKDIPDLVGQIKYLH